MAQFISKIKDALLFVMLLSYFVGHPVHQLSITGDYFLFYFYPHYFYFQNIHSKNIIRARSKKNKLDENPLLANQHKQHNLSICYTELSQMWLVKQAYDRPGNVKSQAAPSIVKPSWQAGTCYAPLRQRVGPVRIQIDLMSTMISVTSDYVY